MTPDTANRENPNQAPAHREEKNQNPARNESARFVSDSDSQDDPQPNPDHPTESNPKRNSGRTGATSSVGRATCARNATRHGLCATTLILAHESEADWLQLLDTWLEGYRNPADHSLLYTFVLKTAQAEWFRLRAQKEYDFFLNNHGNPPITAWEPLELKAHDLVQRYLTTAERKFQRDYRLLEHHWKAHHQPAPESKEASKQPPPEPESPAKLPTIRFINNETGESVDCEGNEYPPPAGYVSKPIIPGVYDPDHPAYEEQTPQRMPPNEPGRRRP